MGGHLEHQNRGQASGAPNGVAQRVRRWRYLGRTTSLGESGHFERGITSEGHLTGPPSPAYHDPALFGTSRYREPERTSPHDRDINRQGTTILLVEQNAAMTLSIAHRGYVLETGNIALHGSAADLQEHPDVKRAYLGEGA
jgi:hypothetical protein